MKKLIKYKHLITAYIVSFIAIYITILPITWIFLLSIKNKGQTLGKPPKWLFDPTAQNYINLMDNDFFKDTFWNTMSAFKIVKYMDNNRKGNKYKKTMIFASKFTLT